MPPAAQTLSGHFRRTATSRAEAKAEPAPSGHELKTDSRLEFLLCRSERSLVLARYTRNAAY
jgi:hypothetical protein